MWTAPRGPPHPAGGALPWTEPGPPPQEGLQRQASPAGLGQGIRSSAALALPRVHITCSPGIRPRCCPRHRRLGGGGQAFPRSRPTRWSGRFSSRPAPEQSGVEGRVSPQEGCSNPQQKPRDSPSPTRCTGGQTAQGVQTA